MPDPPDFSPTGPYHRHTPSAVPADSEGMEWCATCGVRYRPRARLGVIGRRMLQRFPDVLRRMAEELLLAQRRTDAEVQAARELLNMADAPENDRPATPEEEAQAFGGGRFLTADEVRELEAQRARTAARWNADWLADGLDAVQREQRAFERAREARDDTELPPPDDLHAKRRMKL